MGHFPLYSSPSSVGHYPGNSEQECTGLNPGKERLIRNKTFRIKTVDQWKPSKNKEQKSRKRKSLPKNPVHASEER